MNVVGIIAEYNPFHNGHLFHLQAAKENCDAQYAICVMSGHFLQRGEPALFNKWSRAAMAVSAGADIVFELPCVYACRSAGIFARGGVELLAATGIVTHLCFGSEHGSIQPLKEIALLLAAEPTGFRILLQDQLQQGKSFPAARYTALQEYCRLIDPHGPQMEPEILTHPNNTLGIEYLIALEKLGNPMTPLTIKRCTANYHDQRITGPIASASAIRHLLEVQGLSADLGQVVPSPVDQIMQNCVAQEQGPVFLADFTRMALACLRRATLEELALILDVNEGLEYKLKEAANTASSLEELLTALKSKRYTRTRLQRLLFYCLLNLKKHTAAALDEAGPQYLRVLAFSEQGQTLLKQMRKNAQLPIIHRPAIHTGGSAQSSLLTRMLLLDILSTDLYVLGCPHPQRGGLDYLKGAVRVNKDTIPHNPF